MSRISENINSGQPGRPKRQTASARRSAQRRISVRAIRREQPDIRRLGRVFIALALAQAERDAAAAQVPAKEPKLSSNRRRAEAPQPDAPTNGADQ